MRVVGIYSTVGSDADIGVFKRACKRWTDEIYAVNDGKNLAALCHRLTHKVRIGEREQINHLIFSGHGGPNWLISPKIGVVNHNPKGRQISAFHFANALFQSLEDGILISLAACLCSRSPRWYLDHKYGRRIDSDWGQRAYLPGGQYSFSSKLRNALWHLGKRSYVRGHRAVGHATHLALLAEHSWPHGEPCKTLYQYCFPGVVPTLRDRRKWIRIVSGYLAEQWLMGDDRVVDEIRKRW